MKPRVTLFVETSPLNFETALIFATDVDLDNNGASVYLKPDKVRLAIALLAETVGAEVIIDGEKIEREL